GIRKIYRATLKNGNFIEFTDDHLIKTSTSRTKDPNKYYWEELKNIIGNKILQYSPKQDHEEYFSCDEQKKFFAQLSGWVIGDGYYGKYPLKNNHEQTQLGVVTINNDEFKHVTGLFDNLYKSHTVVTKKNISENYRIVKHDFKEVDDFVNE
ncbi:MAG: hypothetical protein HQK96_17895, partial [Nitrospirae bacterium]|nr:hypothetical protein [Nitrospirota bacterium]